MKIAAERFNYPLREVIVHFNLSRYLTFAGYVISLKEETLFSLERKLGISHFSTKCKHVNYK